MLQEVIWHGSHFSGHIKTRVTTSDLVSCGGEEEVAGHSKKTVFIKLLVPPLPPSYLNNCSIIDLQYYLKVCGVLGMEHIFDC